MSGRREHRKRNNQKLMFISEFTKWLETEPKMLLFWRWRRWKASRPLFDRMMDDEDE